MKHNTRDLEIFMETTKNFNQKTMIRKVELGGGK